MRGRASHTARSAGVKSPGSTKVKWKLCCPSPGPGGARRQRSGRLDALFLDEGFGSLDANSLAEALDALGRQAETGRLVAGIGHLRSVAEALDRVLAITT